MFLLCKFWCLSKHQHAAPNLSHFPDLRMDLHCRWGIHSVSCGVTPVIKGGNVLKYLPGSDLAGAPGCTGALCWVLFKLLSLLVMLFVIS